MRKIYYLQTHLVKTGDVIEHNGFRATVTEELVELNPDLFIAKDTIQELLDKAREDYPIGTMFNSKYGIQKVLGDNPFMGIGIPGTIQINTDRFTGGATIYTPEDGWAEILPLKFTTEDGVDIYGDMKTYLVHPNDSFDICFRHALWDGNTKRKSCKYFYHKENALAYIEKHKEKTLEDYENMLLRTNINSINAREVCWFYNTLKGKEPKLYYTKILQLIADDLNDGWVADFNSVIDKKYHISYNRIDFVWTLNAQGIIVFKSEELAEKARSILGDKLKCLFN